MFDMIYHEHKDYHTLKPLPKFLKKFGFGVSKVERLPNHGGSIRVHVKRGPGLQTFDEPEIDWAEFQKKIDAEGELIRSCMGGRIVAFGATAKATTLIHHFGLADKIAYCVDETPQKQGLFIPGTAIQISGPERMKTEPPDAILLTAWNYADILRPRFTERLIVPFERKAA